MAVAAGTELPRPGFGTCGRTGPEGTDAIPFVPEAGHRHLDTAQGYGTGREAGEAARHSGLPRAEEFVTTKAAGENLGRVVPST